MIMMQEAAGVGREGPATFNNSLIVARDQEGCWNILSLKKNNDSSKICWRNCGLAEDMGLPPNSYSVVVMFRHIHLTLNPTLLIP